ncbi:MAG: hypothetical protein Q8R34_01795 [bacterium]|nr:hypothetical protein [bacterium]
MIDVIELKNKLLSFGAPSDELDKIIVEVNEIVLAKVMTAYIKKLSDEQVARLKLIPENQLIEYLSSNKSDFPIFSKEEFEKVYIETWQNYFSAIKK